MTRPESAPLQLNALSITGALEHWSKPPKRRDAHRSARLLGRDGDGAKGVVGQLEQWRGAACRIAGCRKRRMRCARSSGDLLPPSPPAEKATARQDQAGKASTGDAARDTTGDRGIVPQPTHGPT